MKRSKLLRLLPLALMAASGGGLAWQPPGSAPSQGAQAPPGYGPPRAAPMDATPLARPSAASGTRWRGRVQMRQTRTNEHYVLEIVLDGLGPENIQVRAAGQSLVVRARIDARERRSQTSGDGWAYSESYRVTGGGSTRRLPVPSDGLVGRFQREDGPDQIRILIPRRPADEAGVNRFGS